MATFTSSNSTVDTNGSKTSFSSIFISAGLNNDLPTPTSNTGENNLAIGSFALNEITSGQDNLGLGSSALREITSGTHNTVVGRGAGRFITDGSGNTVMGSNAFAFPHLQGAGGNTATGSSSNNTFIGFEAGQNCSLGNVDSNDVICIGSGADVSSSGSTNEIVIGTDAQGNGSNTTTIGNSSTSTTYIKGNIQIESDRRLKKNIKPLKNSLNKLLNLEGKQYNLKHKSKSKKINIGLIAQEVKDIFPELVSESPNKDKTLSINYIGMIPILINALKEQNKILKKQQRQINILEKKINN